MIATLAIVLAATLLSAEARPAFKVDPVPKLNVSRVGTPAGPPSDIDGWAEAEDASNPAALTVHLQGVPVPAPYWVIMLGEPVVQGGPYTYSIVSDPFQLSLFVLARNITDFRQHYQAQVYDRLNKMGYNNELNKPLPTRQEGCW